jgi:glycoside/pentoside/hexuronide:cation symporter, GPH family
MTTTLPFKTRLGYGMGDFGSSLYLTTATLYLLYYYTDVLGLSPATAGWIFAIAMVWDALFDPLMAVVAGRTRSRWGRYRPYLLFGSVPAALSFALMFLPVGLKGSALLIFTCASHILFRSLFGVVTMPYLALQAVITQDSHERGVLAGYRLFLGAGCGLIAAAFTLALAEWLGGGQRGFFWVASLYGVVATASYLVTFFTIKETDQNPGEIAPTVAGMAHMLAKNRAFWIAASAMLVGAFGSTILNKSIPYYFKYVLGRDDLIGPALGSGVLAIAVSVPFWTSVMHRGSKRFMWICGTGVALLGSAALYYTPIEPGWKIAAIAMIGFGTGAGYLGIWAMMPDTVEYGEWRSGVRSEGAIFGIVSLVQKCAFALAAGFLGQMLSWIGYTANKAQSAETLRNLARLTVFVPAAFAILAAVIIGFYPIGPDFHARLRRALARRKARFDQMQTAKFPLK